MMQSQVVCFKRSNCCTRRLIVLAGIACTLFAGSALAQKPLGIDVSAWQGTLTQANWNSVYASGRVFAFIRVTHVGATNGDPDTQYVNNFACATNAGLLTGPYNFARPTILSPSDDAQHFLDYASPYITAGHLPPVLDLEEGNGVAVVGAANLSAWAVAWLNYVEAQTGVRPLVYCNGTYASAVGASLTSYNLWFANFTCPSNPQTASPAASYSPWPKYTFWQYCSTQTVPGISGACDMDIFNGTLAELQALVIGGTGLPPVISNVQAGGIVSTGATITWTTDTASTSQVEYGPTTSYGYWTAEDSTLVTSHTVPLTGLSPLTQYHYRVYSRDTYGLLSTSDDYTFTTTSSDVVADIILDNPACTFVGSWSTGTSSTDKYGADYRYATTATSETATATFRPTILTAGNYDVYCWYPQGTNRSAMAPYTVYWNGGSQTVSVNQQANGGKWNLLVSGKPFLAGTTGYVKIGNNTSESSKVVMADAVKFVYAAGADTEPPTIPTGLAATPASMTQVNLSWTASTDNVGVTGYKVFRNSALIGTSATTSYSDTACSPNTTYAYTVSAYDAANNESAQSAPANVTTPGDTTPPSVPTNLAATPVSRTQVNLTWTASTDNVGVAGYKVYRNSVQIGTSATTSYSDTTCTAGTTYTYQVSAYDAANNESAKCAGVNATTPNVSTKDYAPSAITRTRGTVSSGSVANLAANDSSYLVISAARVGSTRYVDWYSSVTIAEAPASITKLTIAFDGKLSASLNQRLYLYNWTTSSWTQIDSRTVGTSDVTVSWNTTTPASYISSTGQIHLRQYVTRSSSFTSSTDFVRFTVEY